MIFNSWLYFPGALALLSGCLPATATVAPAVHGRVVRADGSPVRGAVVTVGPVKSDSYATAYDVKTDAAGRFHHAEQTRWTMAPMLPADIIAPRYQATATSGEAQSRPKVFSQGLVQAHFLGVTNYQAPVELGDLVVDTTAAY
jgi:hypothetical protein